MKNFSEQVYELTKNVPAGKVTTYKEIALALNTKAYQAVGQALKRNPYAPTVPCHRVVKNNGEIGGFRGNWDNNKKVELLKEEGVEIKNNMVDLKRFNARRILI